MFDTSAKAFIKTASLNPFAFIPAYSNITAIYPILGRDSVALVVCKEVKKIHYVKAKWRVNLVYRWIKGQDTLCDTSRRQVTATIRLIWASCGMIQAWWILVKIFVAATEFCRCEQLHEFKRVWIRVTDPINGSMSDSSVFARLCTLLRTVRQSELSQRPAAATCRLVCWP